MPNFEVVVRMRKPKEDRMIVGAESESAAVDGALIAFGPEYEFVSVDQVPAETLEEVLARHAQV